MKTIVRGLAIEYSDEGAGEVLLMLHGWGDSMRTFDELCATLSGHLRVVRLDLPGFGESEIPKSAWNVGEYAQFVRAFERKLGITAKAILGHSFGGRIAIKGVGTGVLSPQKLVLIAAAGNARRTSLRSMFFLLLAKAGKIIALVLPQRVQSILRTKLYQRAQSDYLNAGPMKEIFLKTVAEDLSQDAAKITIPTLLIWGKEDETTPIQDGERFHKSINGSKFSVLEDAGHFVHREKSGEVAALIEAFV